MAYLTKRMWGSIQLFVVYITHTYQLANENNIVIEKMPWNLNLTQYYYLSMFIFKMVNSSLLDLFIHIDLFYEFHFIVIFPFKDHNMIAMEQFYFCCTNWQATYAVDNILIFFIFRRIDKFVDKLRCNARNLMNVVIWAFEYYFI